MVSPRLFFRAGSRGVIDYTGAPEFAKTVDDEWVSFWLRAGGVEIITGGGNIAKRWAIPVRSLSDRGMAARMEIQNERSRALKRYFEEAVWS